MLSSIARQLHSSLLSKQMMDGMFQHDKKSPTKTGQSKSFGSNTTSDSLEEPRLVDADKPPSRGESPDSDEKEERRRAAQKVLGKQG